MSLHDEPNTPAGDKAVNAAFHAEHAPVVEVTADGIVLDYGDHAALPNVYEGWTVPCQAWHCDGRAALVAEPHDVLLHAVHGDHNITLTEDYLADLLITAEMSL